MSGQSVSWHYRLTKNSPAARVLSGLVLLLLALNANSAQSDCQPGQQLSHSFDSGAAWSLCVQIDEQHGLEISSVFYRAPGDTSRQVLRSLHLGQLLLHYHDKPSPEPQFGTPLSGLAGLGGLSELVLAPSTCDGELVTLSGDNATICITQSDSGILAKYSQRPALQGQNWRIMYAAQRESIVWSIAVTFTDDGRITPGLALSGRLERTSDNPHFAQLPYDSAGHLFTRATIVATWRMAFALDTPAIDRAEEFDFPLDITLGNRRPMRVTPLDNEAFRVVDREKFRGWRVVDASGAGYYLDPANSGYSYAEQSQSRAQFDLALTRFEDCERHATNNSSHTTATDAPICGNSLDDFVNGESISRAGPVLWYRQTRSLRPDAQDWPVIRDVELNFDLLPFDWTAASPFELINE